MTKNQRELSLEQCSQLNSDHIFDFITLEENAEIKFELKLSILEIYKENIRDLLDPTIPSSELKIKEHPKKGIYVQNLTKEYISTPDEIFMLIDQAEQFRAVTSTGLNAQSSRSHMLLSLDIHQTMPDETEKSGVLYLCDLAGSEKISKTKAEGETLEEAKKINLSLSTLGNVISSLTTDGKKEFIPYRESKLTRILQDSLGGNNKTTLIVTCSPHVYNIEETVGTLKFASRAKKIQNKVKLNIKLSVEQLESIVEKLKKDLELSKSKISKLKQLLAKKGLTAEEMGEVVLTDRSEDHSITTVPSQRDTPEPQQDNSQLQREIDSLKAKLEEEKEKTSKMDMIEEIKQSIQATQAEFSKFKERTAQRCCADVVRQNNTLKQRVKELEVHKIESVLEKIEEKDASKLTIDSAETVFKFDQAGAKLLEQIENEEIHENYEHLLENCRSVR